jgi:hypothetical protein
LKSAVAAKRVAVATSSSGRFMGEIGLRRRCRMTGEAPIVASGPFHRQAPSASGGSAATYD